MAKKYVIMKKYFFTLWAIFVVANTYCQDKKNDYIVRTIAFYNVENLFDTINNPNKFDDDRTPQGKDAWNTEKYKDHLTKISQVIEKIGFKTTNSAPDVIGLAEIENYDVLLDLVNTPALKKYGYSIAHFDSPDSRGVDVALLYKTNTFLVDKISKHELKIFDPNGKRRYTRDQLLVSGKMDGDQMHIIVNHWPSRVGGESNSSPHRKAAAQLNKQIIDSLQAIDPSAKVISMGDFNDDATNASFKKVLKTKADKNSIGEKDLYNPMENMYKKGIGSLAYRDSWSLFDQIYFTHGLLFPKNGYQYWKAFVFNEPMVVAQSGQYKGYPNRSYSNGNYTGGYSDHFPVYIHIIKKM